MYFIRIFSRLFLMFFRIFSILLARLLTMCQYASKNNQIIFSCASKSGINMRPFSFCQLSPSGNVTVFLKGCLTDADRAWHCGQAVARLNAEQAGYADVDAKSLAMGGGEFCGNACRAFGALLDLHDPRSDPSAPLETEIHMAGFASPIHVRVAGASPLWHCAATFALRPAGIGETPSGALLVHLPGISHALIKADPLPPAEDLPGLAMQAFADLGLMDAPAAGIIWWRPGQDCYEITPYVRVLNPYTAMPESACGSGSMALAFGLGLDGGRIRARQPCGEIIEVGVAGGHVSIAGEVRLLARGEIWLEEKN